MRLPLPIGVTALALLLAACSSPAAPGTGAKLSPKPAASASPTSSPAVVTLTGAQLDAGLAPPSSFSGFTANTKYAYDGGTGTSALPSQYGLATMSCTTFSTQMLYATEFGQTAIAWAEYDRATGGQSSQTYDEFVYQFADDASANSFIQELRSAYGRCRSYTDVESGVSVRTTYRVADVAPVDGGLAIRVTANAVASPGTVAGQLLYVLSGKEVYGVVRAGALTAIPGSPAARTVIDGMMTRVQNMSH